MGPESRRLAGILIVLLSAVAMAVGALIPGAVVAQGAAPSPTAQDSKPAAPGPQALFLVQFTTGPGWVADKPAHEQQHFAAHSANLRRLRESGRLLVGARYSDKGMVIVRATDEAAVQAELDADASVRAGVFKAEIFAFSPFYDGCIPKPAPAARTE